VICLVLLSLVLASFAAAQQEQGGPCDLVRGMSLRKSARSAFEKRQYDVAARQFQQAFDACPTQRDILIELSEVYARRREFQQAIHTAQQFLELQPGSTPGRLALANAYFMAQRFTDALEVTNQVLKTESGQATALKLKGNCEYLLGNYAQAQDTFIDLLDHHPNDEEGPYMLGRIYYQQAQIDHAMGQFERVLKLNPKSYKAYDNLGLCYQARGETDLAIRYFLTAIKLVEKDHPDYDVAYADLADLLLETGDAEKAFASASKAADRNPYSARNFYLGGKALCKLEKTDLCMNWLERSASLDTNYPEPLYLLARVYSQLGKEEKARQALEKFRELKAKAPATKR
jgi:tetratricopeptide (TPR) repeat protein